MSELGRPTKYTDELAEDICLKISTSSKGLIALCAENPHWPTRETIFQWRITRPKFSYMYTQAKCNQVEALVDECLDIADDATFDTITKKTKHGDEYEAHNTEWANRSRLRVDTRKWLASKLAPRMYGDKSTETNSTTDGVAECLAEMKELALKCMQPK